MKLISLKPNEIIDSKTIFIDGDGKQFTVDKKGQILGIKVLGEKVKKEGSFFKMLDKA